MKNLLRLNPLVIKKDEEYKSKTTNNRLILDELDKLNATDRLKLRFNLDDITSTFEYHGLKIVVCDQPDLFVRNLLNNNETYSKVLINDSLVRNKNIFHIHTFSKISDFLNNKNNGILHEYLKSKDIEANNKEFEEFIGQKYYDFKDEYLESISEINLEKASILDYIDVNKEYIDSKNIVSLLNIIRGYDKNKQLVIINDYNIIDIEDIICNFIDHFNFLIVTNDLNKWIKDFKFIECIIVINKFINEEFHIDSLEVLDQKTLFKYLEKRMKYNKTKDKKFLENKI